MANKLKEGLREMKDSVVEKIKGPKYQTNDLGEPLPKLLKRATSKLLYQPDRELNSLITVVINNEIQRGIDPKDIVALLKQRLSMDNPLKQWLAIHLVRKVLHNCQASLGFYHEDLLREVAKVMSRPSHQSSEMGIRTRQEAKELLREFGRAGINAFRATRGQYRQNIYGPSVVNGTVVPGYALQGQSPPPPPVIYTPMVTGQTLTRTGVPVALSSHPTPDARVSGTAGTAAESSGLVDELAAIVDQARANADLLRELLSAKTQNGALDDFEKNLISDLTSEVGDLKGLIISYVEQLQRHSGYHVEAMMAQALEASDLIDRVLADDLKTPKPSVCPPMKPAPKSPKPTRLEEPSLLDSPLSLPLSNPVPLSSSSTSTKKDGTGSSDLISLDIQDNEQKDPFAMPVTAPHPSLGVTIPPPRFDTTDLAVVFGDGGVGQILPPPSQPWMDSTTSNALALTSTPATALTTTQLAINGTLIAGFNKGYDTNLNYDSMLSPSPLYPSFQQQWKAPSVALMTSNSVSPPPSLALQSSQPPSSLMQQMMPLSSFKGQPTVNPELYLPPLPLPNHHHHHHHHQHPYHHQHSPQPQQQQQQLVLHNQGIGANPTGPSINFQNLTSPSTAVGSSIFGTSPPSLSSSLVYPSQATTSSYAVGPSHVAPAALPPTPGYYVGQPATPAPQPLFGQSPPNNRGAVGALSSFTGVSTGADVLGGSLLYGSTASTNGIGTVTTNSNGNFNALAGSYGHVANNRDGVLGKYDGGNNQGKVGPNSISSLSLSPQTQVGGRMNSQALQTQPAQTPIINIDFDRFMAETKLR
mmetsp:Transcript_10305/g.19013  ORF Transcript_10305/g.19013 Transcript_10305/m.19013 type:complete len:812 (-) Transcript_10305:1299-3734(-)|eukprot:CAMPEP_0175039208 /NCGR_PEP_ID=MMETSP0052_2-20121109/407_1 /TAXON_ID=51329 ORGANISM="Polytomella parva, Strain SAG 63-3" /NCGR_SAMPLE_ID=MMETSP0052_2 /ASSEMBLY_ACC=CAM_ASM_000194 /LENGTH=811 /DNA_ID=CAMNT_0016300937 /DNA_START=74 /DNA_END=2509 /DNA_ORIENTATION=+